jgi:hypothetical protein
MSKILFASFCFWFGVTAVANDFRSFADLMVWGLQRNRRFH